MKRIFIEIDRDNEYNRSMLDATLDGCLESTLGFETDVKVSEFFDRIICDARNEENLFQYIMKADEIYMSTSIVPLVFGTLVGSPHLWNTMMLKAVEHNLSGKKIFNLNSFKSIHWEYLDKTLFKKAFSNNQLFILDNDSNWIEVKFDEINKK